MTLSNVYLGLDYGDKTIGVAVSLNGRTATGVKTLWRKDSNALRACLKELKVIISEYGVNSIVLGYPKNMSGEDSLRCGLTLAFKEKLERYFKSKTIILWDERLSTRAVSRVFEGKKAGYDRHVDTMAAVYILQGYLDYKNKKEETNMDFGKMDVDYEPDDLDDSIVLVNDDGDEIPLQILASREDETGMYVLATEDDDNVAHFKCIPTSEDEVTFEMIDSEHEDFERVFNLFKDDYEPLGIDIEEIDID